MALVLNDRVKETTTSTGTGTINLAGAETGFITFVSGVGNSNTCYYCIAHQSANEYEVGLGTVSDSSPDTLSRTSIISSSNSNSAVNFSAGTKDVFCTLPASKSIFGDSSGNVGIGIANPSKKLHVKGDEIYLEDPSGGYRLELNADTNPVTITANDKTGANYAGFKLRTLNGGSSPVTAMDVYPNGGASVGFGTTARTDTQMVISKRPTSATQTTPETILTLANPCTSTASDIKVGQGPRIVFEIPDDQSGNKATGAAIAALKEVDSDTNSQTSLAFYTSDDDETLDQNMTILSDGKVGIGTTSPGTLLHVESSATASTIIRVKGTVADGYRTGHELINGHTGGLTYSIFSTNNSDGIFGGGKFVIGNDATNSVNGSTAGLLVMDSSGNVGIGTISPSHRLTVNSGSTAVSAKLITTAATGYLQLDNSGGSSGILSNGDALGIFTTSSGTERLRISDNGFINLPSQVSFSGTGDAGLGHHTNNYMYIYGGTAGLILQDNSGGSNRVLLRDSNTIEFETNGSTRMSLDSSGNLVASGNITAYGSPSDIKLKENIEVIDNAVDKVKQLKGITYDLKSDGNRLTGLIAQDLEKVLPEAVYTAKDLEGEEHLAIRYGNTVGLLVEAIKEQQEQIETLTAKVKELEGK